MYIILQRNPVMKLFISALCLTALVTFSACQNFRGDKSEVKTQAVEQAVAPVELAPQAVDATPAPAVDAHAEQALAEQPK
jgi:predicted outer membrane protein